MIGRQLNKHGRDITTKAKKALIETLAENDRLKYEITRFRDLITEKRSDIDDILTAILENKEWQDNQVEQLIKEGKDIDIDNTDTLNSLRKIVE